MSYSFPVNQYYLEKTNKITIEIQLGFIEIDGKVNKINGNRPR